LNKKQIIYFPTTLGLTGEVFKKGNLRIVNSFNYSMNPEYMDDIDNIHGVKLVKDLMFGGLEA
jgi:hypothetical protein